MKNNFDTVLKEIGTQVDIAYTAGGEEAMAGGLDNIEERVREARLLKLRVKMEIIGLIGRFLDGIFDEPEPERSHDPETPSYERKAYDAGYAQGVRDQESRSRSTPGHGDMGG